MIPGFSARVVPGDIPVLRVRGGGGVICKHERPCLCNVNLKAPVIPPRPDEGEYVLKHAGVAYCRLYHTPGCACVWRLFMPTREGKAPR